MSFTVAMSQPESASLLSISHSHWHSHLFHQILLALVRPIQWEYGLQIQTWTIIWGGWQVNWNEEAELALWAYETVFLHSLKPLRSLLDLAGLLTSWTLDTCLQSADFEVQKLWERVCFTAVYLDCFKKCCIWLRYQHIHCGETNIPQTFPDRSHQC